MKKRIISILISVGLLLSMIPLTATPAGAASINGLDITSDMVDSFPTGVDKETALSSAGYYWDGVLKELTLRDLTVTGAIKFSVPGIVTLYLEGANVISYGADGGIYSVDSDMLRLDIKGAGTLALNATSAATNDTSSAIYVYQPCTVRIDGARVTVNHNASVDNPCAINIQEIGSSPRGGLEVVNGGYLRVERGGLTVSGRILVDGEGSYMSVTAMRGNMLSAAAVCGMVEVKDKGELYINETSGTSVTALQSLSTYAGSNGFALRVDGGKLDARGTFYGAFLLGSVFIGNDANVTIYSAWDDALYITGNLYLEGDYYLSAATGGGFWNLGFAMRLVGNQYISTTNPGGEKIIKGSRYSSQIVDMNILPSYSFFRGIWLGLFSQGFVMGGNNLLKRFKIMPKLNAHDCTIPGTYQVGTDPALSYDFATEAGVKGGVKPYKYEFFGPEWLKIDPVTGMITSNGAPSAPADATIAMVTITDSDTIFDSSSNANSITVKVYVGEVLPLPLAVTCPVIPERNVNEAVASIQAAGTGGTAPYLYSMTGPAWLSIDPLTGVISGTPTQAAPATTATVTVTDCNAPTPTSVTITIQVGAVLGPLTFTNYGWGVPSTYTDTVLTRIDVSAGVAGGKPDYYYTMTGPSWLSIDPLTGQIFSNLPGQKTPATYTAGITGGITVTVEDAKGNTAGPITLDVGAVNIPLVASDLFFMWYPEFDVPRTYPHVALDGEPVLGANETCSVRPVSINVASGVSGGTKPYTFSMDYANYGTALGYPTGSDYVAPTWLKIVEYDNQIPGKLAGELYSDLSSVNRKAQKVRIWVEDADHNKAFITVAIGPVSDLRFNDVTRINTITGIAESTGYSTGPTTGYGVPPANGGTAVYYSGNDTDPPYPKCMHPHYGMIGGSPSGSGLGAYSFAIIEGPEWLTLGLYGCFVGKYHSDGTTLTTISSSASASDLQKGVRPDGPRPATTVTIKFYDSLGADEIITLPVGEIYGVTGHIAPFTFALPALPANAAKYNIPARLVGTPIPTTPESPTNLDVSRLVSGATRVEYSLVMGNGKTWVEIDPDTGIITGEPDGDDVSTATTATITARSMEGDTEGQTRSITITVGAVMLTRLSFEKPATGADIPTGEINTHFDEIDCACCVGGGVGPYTYSIDSFIGTASNWDTWVRIHPTSGKIEAGGGTRPGAELPETIATVKVTDALGDWRSIAVNVGAVTSTPLVFVWLDTYEIEAGLEGTAILGLNVSGSASGGGGPLTYQFTKDSGPGWLTVNLDGTIVGTREDPESNPDDLVVRVTDNAGNTRPITIKVGEVKPNVPPIPPLSYNGGTLTITERQVGQAISPTINAATVLGITGGVPGYTYSIAGPEWVVINPTTGVISGKPTASDSARTATVIVTDSAAPPNTCFIPIAVEKVIIPQPLTFTKYADHDIPPGAAGTPIAPIGTIDSVTGSIDAVWGGWAPYTFSMTVAGNSSAATLGYWDWLISAFDTATGVISGTPNDITKPRPATTATITVRDSAGATKSITISIGAISSAPLVFTLNNSIDDSGTGDTVSVARSWYSNLTGGTTPYTYSIVSGPSWLSINSSTGLISGVPMDPDDPTNVVVRVTDNEGQWKEITVPVGEVTGIPLLRFTYSADYDIPPRVVGAAYTGNPINISQAIIDRDKGVYGGTTPYTFSISGPGSFSAGGWLDINPTTGVISGTPGATHVGPATTVTVTVKDSASPQGVKSITINVGIVTEVLEFTKDSSYDIPWCVRDTPITPFSVYGGVSGGTEPYKFRIASGPATWSNPGDLRIDPVTGWIEGRPMNNASATTVVIEVTDSAIPIATKTITIDIGPVVAPLTFNPLPGEMDVPAGKVGVPFLLSAVPINPATGAINVVNGGTLPYTFSITGGPDWLLIDPATGVLSGIPNAAAAAILSGVTITVIDSSVPRATQTKPITVGAVTAATGPVALGFLDTPAAAIPAGYVGVAIAPLDVSGRAYGGTGAYTYSLTGPAWLRIDPATGIITGTPSAANPITTTATVTVKDGAGATKSITVKVGAISASPVTLSLTFDKLTGFDIPAGEGGVPISPVNASGGVYGGTLPYTYSISGPSWLSIDANGIITGTPPAGGTTQTTATITVRDKDGTTVTQTIVVGRMDAVPSPITPPPTGTISIGTGEEGSDVSVNISGYITGGYRPLTYSVTVADGSTWLTINPTTGVLSGKRPPAPRAATSATITVTDAKGNSIQFTVPIGAVNAKPVTNKYIFSTKWLSNFWNWIMFIFLFGWIWMWFISPRA